MDDLSFRLGDHGRYPPKNMKRSNASPHKSFRMAELDATDPAMRKTRKLKTLAALTVFACVAGSTLGPIIGMMRSFDSISRGQTVSATELSGSIGSTLNISMILLPVAFIAAIAWFTCWRRLRPKFRIDCSTGSLDANQQSSGG